MRRQVDAGPFHFPEDLAYLSQAAAPAEIGLRHVDLPPRDQIVESPGGRLLLSRGQPRPKPRLFDLRIALIAFRMQKVFQPENLKRLQVAQQCDGVEGAAVHLPAWIDQQSDVRTYRFPRRLHQGDIALAVLSENPPAELDSRETALQVGLAGAFHGVRRGAE